MSIFTSIHHGHFSYIKWLILYSVVIGWIIGINVYFHKKYQTIDEMELSNTYRDIPSNLSPAVAGYLLNGKVSLNLVYGTLLFLVNKRILHIEKRESEILFSLIKPEESLSKIEEFIINWLFNKEKNQTLSMKQFKNHYKTESSRKALVDLFIQLEKLIKPEVSPFFKDSKEIRRKLFKYHLIYFLGTSIFSFILLSPAAFFIIGFLTVMSLYQTFGIREKTALGKEEIAKWYNFSTFLKERIDTNHRETLEITLWDHYMSYAVALNQANKALDELDWLSGDVVEVKNGASFITYIHASKI
jgi:uncharacterized membrane protein